MTTATLTARHIVCDIDTAREDGLRVKVMVQQVGAGMMAATIVAHGDGSFRTLYIDSDATNALLPAISRARKLAEQYGLPCDE